MKIEQVPKEIRDFIVSIGRAEWGQTPAHDADGHGKHIADSVRITAAHFDQMEDQTMHGLYIEGTRTIICHTGTSPNSPKSAQALTGMWNWILDLALDLQRDCTMCDGTGTKDHAALGLDPCDHVAPPAIPDEVAELVTAARQMLWCNHPGFTGDEGAVDRALQAFNDRVPA